jgi:hypothetical protein
MQVEDCGYIQRLWSRTRWLTILGYSKGVKTRLHHWWQTPDNKLDISLPSGGIWGKSNKSNPIISGIITAKQGSRSKFTFLDRVRHDNMSECRGRNDHEGKTSGSILYGLILAHKCALLANFRIHDTKKIPMDALGTLKKYWNSCFHKS